ncbi:MAG TPA: prolyl oligopeptidase family serine peptidase [Bryobacteraceae bacterium]|jgi:dipeptidyl aminopeptidase/acylaminoacyl peptidase|nr:prolyl oligopeptidase family serine peptidase [Bryobacteraceae bacterium]
MAPTATSAISAEIFFTISTKYWNTSPLHYVQNVKTPALVLHSDNDYRVPIEQGEQWFRALQRYYVTSEIVFFRRKITI